MIRLNRVAIAAVFVDAAALALMVALAAAARAVGDAIDGAGLEPVDDFALWAEEWSA